MTTHDGMQLPKVSVVITTKNRSTQLAEAIESALALDRTRFDLEIIVVDDGSTDDTPEVLQRYPVRVIRTEGVGMARARSIGLEAATGDFFGLLDDDDVWLPTAITTQLTEFERHPEYGAVHAQAQMVGPTLVPFNVPLRCTPRLRPPGRHDSDPDGRGPRSGSVRRNASWRQRLGLDTPRGEATRDRRGTSPGPPVSPEGGATRRTDVAPYTSRQRHLPSPHARPPIGRSPSPPSVAVETQGFCRERLSRPRSGQLASGSEASRRRQRRLCSSHLVATRHDRSRSKNAQAAVTGGSPTVSRRLDGIVSAQDLVGSHLRGRAMRPH